MPLNMALLIKYAKAIKMDFGDTLSATPHLPKPQIEPI